MRLRELLAQVEDLDDDLTIYAEGGANASLDAEAVVAAEPEDGSTPPEAAGLEYLLEVSLATEVLDVWRQWRGGQEPTLEERHRAVTYYATNDAYLPA